MGRHETWPCRQGMGMTRHDFKWVMKPDSGRVRALPHESSISLTKLSSRSQKEYKMTHESPFHKHACTQQHIYLNYFLFCAGRSVVDRSNYTCRPASPRLNNKQSFACQPRFTANFVHYSTTPTLFISHP
jgi:hypothetical protein